MDEIKAGLENIGLSDKEIEVYLALLQLGDASAYSIAAKSGLKNPTTYVVLEELRRKGFVKKIPHSKKWRFRAEPPEEVIALAEERITLLKQTLPKLRSLVRGNATKASTMYFEGLNGIKQLTEYRIKEHKGKELLGFWATDRNVDPELSRYFQEELNEKMLKLGISVRGLAPKDEVLKVYRDTDTKYNREMKILPLEQYSSEIALVTLGDMVRIEDYKNLQGIVIENADIAKTMREIFEMVWAKY